MGEILRRIGGGSGTRPLELFNKSFIEKRSEFVPQSDAPVASYVNYLAGKHSSRGHLGIKILYSQMAMFMKYKDFLAAMAGAKIAYLYRNNVIKQGISFYIASRTQQWTSVPSRPPAADVSEIRYSFADISEAISRMELHNSLLRRFLCANELEYLPICYEDFLRDPEGSADALIRYLGIPPWERPTASTGAFTSQSTTKNEEFYNQFIIDERRRCFGDGTFTGPPLFRSRSAP